MKRFVFLLVLSAGIAGLYAQSVEPMYKVPVGTRATISTAQGIKLPSSFGNPSEYFAVVQVTDLKPGTKYMATITFEGGTGIYYGMVWVNGNPYIPDWNHFVGIGSGTGSGRLMPGYYIYHIFATDPKSVKDRIYFVVRSDKPWTLDFVVTPAKPGVDRNTKNMYDYYCVDDLTNGDTVSYLLTKD